MQYSQKFLEKLSQFEKFVIETNQIHNLISKSSEADIRNRHSLDSLKIIPFIENNLAHNRKFIICDFGSGAGFPAITNALYFTYEKPIENLKIYAFESIGKKTNFLNEAKNLLGLDNIEIRNQRIESEKNIKADIITARAFASLSDIFSISKNFLKKDTKFILHKGAKVMEEISEAKKKHKFKYDIIKNPDSDGCILLAEI
ncbi:MAG: 16S rRNA (guanine(527)-N(7))-methyltransferase RsmG [Rickettsiales bacterium]|nr:16S rRNA (guanine(527)-N(7))-methyltransferase RsmG [Rickettsiales bacterium]